jgi:hypothetical protein
MMYVLHVLYVRVGLPKQRAKLVSHLPRLNCHVEPVLAMLRQILTMRRQIPTMRPLG